MDESILITVKKMLGITKDYTHFDTDIKILINSSLSTLNQLGVGPKEGYSVEDKMDTWEDFLEDNAEQFSSVVEYVYLSVRVVFDPPTSSFVLEAFNKKLQELTWRLTAQADAYREEEE